MPTCRRIWGKPMYGEFELVIADRLDEALSHLAGDGADGAVALAGGTNLVIDIRSRRVWPRKVVSLDRVDELRGIVANGRRITLGARTTVSEIFLSKEVAAFAPALVEAAGVFGGLMVRNAATVGGNIACGSPAADLIPPLLALDAEVTLSSAGGTRTVPLDAYFTGYRKDVRAPDELIASIAWTRPEARSRHRFYKVGRRKGDAITIAGIAILIAMEGGRCSRARIALNSVAPVVKRARAAEAVLTGEALTPALIDEAAKLAAEACEPIDDLRASADYRRHAVRAVTRRLIAGAWAELEQGGVTR